MSERFVATIPVRLSKTAEKRALTRIRALQRLTNAVLATYLGRAANYARDGDLRRLRAEKITAFADGRLVAKSRLSDTVAARVAARLARPVPTEVVPRRFSFDAAEARNGAWTTVRERHGLQGAIPVAKLSEKGETWYRRDREWIKSLTAAQRALGDAGIGADVIHHIVIPEARDRVLAWLFGKTGKPRFASRRHPLVTMEGSSSSKNAGSLRVDLGGETITWAAAGGKHGIDGRLIIDRDGDPWLRKALKRKIHVVRLTHRVEHGQRRWYAQLVLEGVAPLNPALADAVPRASTVGVDLGVRHYAAVVRDGDGVSNAWLANLAPTAARRERERDANVNDKREGDRRKGDRYVRRLKREIGQRIRRNPANAHAIAKVKKTLVKTRDGKAVGKTVDIAGGFRKGSRIVRSRSVLKIERRVAEISRADAAARDTDHGRTANALLSSATVVALEQLSYLSWQKLYGRRVGRTAVGALVERIKRRAPVFEMRSVVDINPSERLSQVCVVCGTLNSYLVELSKPIADRNAYCACERRTVHLDLYSAFLAASCGEGTSVDPQIAKATWAGAVEHLVSARQTYERADRTAPAVRRAQALRPSRQGPSATASHSAPRGLRSQPHAATDAVTYVERPGGGNAVRDRSKPTGRASPPHRRRVTAIDDARAAPSLELRGAEAHPIDDSA